MSTTEKSEPKAILFDMDGVLTDNHQFHIKSWEELNRKYQLDIDTTEFMEFMSGRTSNDAIRYLFGKDLPQEKVLALADEKEEIYRKIYREHLKPVPGLLQLLADLKKAGWRIAVASSAIPKNIAFVLEGLNIAHYFEAKIDSTQVKKGKPAPDLYLRAAEVLEVAPERCIVFEDSLSGIEAGHAAGMRVIALATTHSREELETSQAGWIFDTFEYVDEKFLNLILTDETE